MHFELTYHEGLSVRPVDADIETLLNSSLWKVRLSALRVARPTVVGQALVCSPELSIGAIRRILSQFGRFESRGLCTVEISPQLEEHLRDEESHIERRARVGISIKLQEEDIKPQFAEFRAAVDSAMVRPLREKQAWDSFFMTTMRHSANFSVPGSGKTASVLGVYAYLHERKMVDRLLVISPINAFSSWRDEWRSCFGEKTACSSLCFHDSKFANKSPEDKRRELTFNASRYNLILINYQACVKYQGELHDIANDRTLLVFDEVHRVKRIGGVQASGALSIARDAPFTIALTGTPIPNSYSDIYNLLNILYPNEYDLYFGFSKQTLANPSQRDIARINESVQPFFCRTNKEMLGVPAPNQDKIVSVRATEEENELLGYLRDEMCNDPLAMIVRIMQLESDASMIFDSVAGIEIASFSSDESRALSDVRNVVLSEHCRGLAKADYPSSKLLACVNLLDELLQQGKSVVVWCVFIHSIEMVVIRLRRLGYAVESIIGETAPEERSRILSAFKRGDIKVLVTNPHTLAESVSLHTVCHDAVYYEYSYNLIHLLQSKDRIHRLGLADEQYTQYYFIQTVFEFRDKLWSLDENIYNRLQEKERIMAEAIDRGVLEVGATDEQDIEIVFKGLFDDGNDDRNQRH